MVSKSKLVNQARQEDSRTENGAVTNSTTLNNVLDLFFIAGSARKLTDAQLERMLMKSYTEDKLSTVKLIFWAGDIRGGAGERRFFKVALNWLYENDKDTFYKNLELVSEFSRWDVLFAFADDVRVMTYIYNNYKEGNGLLSKWMPRKKQYNNFGSKFRKMFGLSPKQYRKSLVVLTNVVETKMCAKQFNTINYEHVPSVASKNYRTAFYKQDEERYKTFIEAVSKGEKKIHASAIFPSDIIKGILNGSGVRSLAKTEKDAIVGQWNSLPNYLEDCNENILPICDTSGSMYWNDCAHVALAMTMYISERNNSVFKDAFITFSSNPQMNYLKGDIYQRAKQLEKAEWGGSTNFIGAMKLILDTAIKNNLSQEDIPTKLLVLSDMEFNCARAGNSEETIHKTVKKMFSDAGFKAPQIVYWNIQSRSTSNFPVSYSEKGTGLISGQSPSILKSVLANELSPEAVMVKTLYTARYERITLG